MLTGAVPPEAVTPVCKPGPGAVDVAVRVLPLCTTGEDGEGDGEEEGEEGAVSEESLVVLGRVASVGVLVDVITSVTTSSVVGVEGGRVDVMVVVSGGRGVSEEGVELGGGSSVDDEGAGGVEVELDGGGGSDVDDDEVGDDVGGSEVGGVDDGVGSELEVGLEVGGVSDDEGVDGSSDVVGELVVGVSESVSDGVKEGEGSSLDIVADDDPIAVVMDEMVRTVYYKCSDSSVGGWVVSRRSGRSWRSRWLRVIV